MVIIRLARRGSKKRPFYQIMVSDNRNIPTGRFIEKIGFFNPIAKLNEQKVKINLNKLNCWVDKGAFLSKRVKFIVKKELLNKEKI